jgi:flagellar biosynthesis GTPase FlhF
MLKAYSEILGIPFFTIRAVEDVDKALMATRSAQLLLVDSEGWNIRRAGGMRKQRQIWDQVPSTHRILVMPANMDEMDGMEMLAKTGAMEVTHLAVTKLDETSRPGKIVNWAAAFGMPLSYCSFGPDVPEQMGWLTPQALTALLSSQEKDYAKETA